MEKPDGNFTLASPDGGKCEENCDDVIPESVITLRDPRQQGD